MPCCLFCLKLCVASYCKQYIYVIVNVSSSCKNVNKLWKESLNSDGHQFLRNYWWQKSDIWSQASYRYPISWEAFFDPSDSYFLFAEEWEYHKWALAHSSSCFKVGIWWVQKHFRRYGVPIWSLWPNIRFLPSTVVEKNATKNEHICSMCIKINKVCFTSVRLSVLPSVHPRYFSSHFSQ
jgi:hypothetical protein